VNLRVLQSVLICLLLCLSAPLAAGEKVMGMSKRVYDGINKVQLLLDEKQWPAAMEELDYLLERRLNSYERAHVLNMKGFSLYQMEELPAALASYEEALTLDGLPDSQVRALLTTASQLALIMEDYALAEKFALRLLASPGQKPPPAASHIILAQAYIGQENYQSAVQPIRAALDMQRKAGQKPRENWMSMLSAVYFSLEDYPNMREALYQLVALYPKERYLINLAALHGQLGETDKQMALVESLLDDQRLEQSSHLLSLVNLMLAHSLPYKAADLLKAEMKAGRIETTQQNLELQSQAWYLAGEEAMAIPPLEAAAEKAEDGELYLRVARLYMDTYDWPNAEKAARSADEKGGLREEGSALLLEGMALARQEKFEPARKAFRRAEKFEENRKWARQWLKFIESEERRIAAFQL
jgi:tetratricopeptide (TPR) repeat protein